MVYPFLIKMSDIINIVEYSTIDSKTHKTYYKNNLLHRENGPAVEYSNGDKEWWVDGRLHRMDGPALDYNEKSRWFINGKPIYCKNNEEFLRLVKLKILW